MGPEAAREFEKFLASKGECINRDGNIVPMENQSMSYKIKPEDVLDKLAIELQDYVSGVTVRAYQHNNSDIINAAIEAGLASPPCHVLRYLGELVCQGGTLDPALFIGKTVEEGDEHWKGQTE